MVKAGAAKVLAACGLSGAAAATGGTAVAVAAVAAGFGALHDYCPGYALLAGLAGAYFGAVYAVSGSLLVAAVSHAVVDVVAFATCYRELCKRPRAEVAALAAKSFKVTDALRATRASFDAGGGLFR